MRWLPCSCDGCFSTVLGPCTQTEVNTGEEVHGAQEVDHGHEDVGQAPPGARIEIRADDSSTRGGCKGGLCAAFVESVEDEPQWDVLEIDGAPRALHKDDIIDGKSGKGLAEAAGYGGSCISFWCLARSGAQQDAEKRRFFEDPTAEKCERDIHECTSGPGSTSCGKWHSEVIFALALCPPLLAPEPRVRSFKKAKRGGGIRLPSSSPPASARASTLPVAATRPLCGRPRGVETCPWRSDAMAHCRAHACLA